jgi:hypothetical protein
MYALVGLVKPVAIVIVVGVSQSFVSTLILGTALDVADIIFIFVRDPFMSFADRVFGSVFVLLNIAMYSIPLIINLTRGTESSSNASELVLFALCFFSLLACALSLLLMGLFKFCKHRKERREAKRLSEHLAGRAGEDLKALNDEFAATRATT